MRALPELADAAAAPNRSATTTTADGLGERYRCRGCQLASNWSRPFTVDPAVVERGLKGHADTQNAHAAAIEAAGLDPRSPRPDEPNFDIGWDRDGVPHLSVVAVRGRQIGGEFLESCVQEVADRGSRVRQNGSEGSQT